jgi:hypothetical protein
MKTHPKARDGNIFDYPFDLVDWHSQPALHHRSHENEQFREKDAGAS